MSSTVTANSFRLLVNTIWAWRAVGAHFINCPRKLLLAHQFQIVPWTNLLQSKALPWKLPSSSALNTDADNFAFSVTVFSSERRWEARAATGTFSKSRQTMCRDPGFLWIFICSLFILALPSTNHHSWEVSLPLQCCTSKSQDQTRRDLGRRSPLSQVPKPCSRLKTPACLINACGYFHLQNSKHHSATTAHANRHRWLVGKEHLAAFYPNHREFGNPVSAAKFPEGPRPLDMSKSHAAEAAVEVLFCITAQ